MAIRVTVDTSEMGRLAADFERGGALVEREARTLLRKTGIDIVRDAKLLIEQLGAVDTGNLLNSVGMEQKMTRSGLLIEIGPTADYGGYVHDGTSRMAPRPYLIPAAERHLPLLERALEQLAERALT